MQSNLYVLPAFGKAITLDDQGTYCVLNRSTGAVQTIIQLIYENDEWQMYQLQKTHDTDEYFWAVLSEKTNDHLESLTSEQIARHFAKPEFSEPIGSWQIIANSQYGFGKFTPIDNNQAIAHAILVFHDGNLRSVIKLHQLPEECAGVNEAAEQSAQTSKPLHGKKSVEFA